MNPIILAIIASLLLGLSMVPWSYTLRVMSGSVFFIGIGIAFIISGIAQMKRPIVYDKNSVLTGLLAIAFYVAGMTVMNFMYAKSRPEHLPAIGAIIAAFVVPALIVNAIVSRTLPTATEIILVIVVTAGCVGLGIVGKHWEDVMRVPLDELILRLIMKARIEGTNSYKRRIIRRRREARRMLALALSS